MIKILMIVLLTILSQASPAFSSSSVVNLQTTRSQSDVDASIENRIPDFHFKIYFDSGNLSELLTAVSAYGLVNIRFAGRGDVTIYGFYFEGGALGLLKKLTDTVPVGYFGNGQEFTVYSLSSKTVKVFSSSTSNLSSVTARFASETRFAYPPLARSTSGSDRLMVEGQEALFGRIDSMSAPDMVNEGSLTVIKFGLTSDK